MGGLTSQKRIASRILKCGITRVAIDPAKIADVSEAITAGDIRRLVSDGVIYAEEKKGNSGFRINKNAAQKKKGRRRGRGSRKGNTAGEKKRAWMARIRAIRKLLRELKETNKISGTTYRVLYIKSKSGQFRSRSHVMIYLERNNLIKK